MTVGLCIKNASLIYCEKPVFSHLNLSVAASKRVALLGPPCIGKSGFLRMIAGKSNPDETIFFQLSSDNNYPVQQQTELVTANDHLKSWLTVFDNLAISLQDNNATSEEQSAIRQRISTLLAEHNLDDIRACYPHQLTPLLRHQIAFIRVLVENKPIVLLDNPFTGLEPLDRMKLNEFAANILANKTVIFITQEPTEALRYANEIFVMQGVPVELTSIASFSTPIPRELSDPQLTAMYTTLFTQLSPVNI